MTFVVVVAASSFLAAAAAYAFEVAAVELEFGPAEVVEAEAVRFALEVGPDLLADPATFSVSCFGDR